MGLDVVVVLSYRGREDTLRCLSSLADGSPEILPVVVDNGSDDGVLDEVLRRWPRAHRIQTGDNLGFSGGMNAGLEQALSLGAETVTVLNNDTVIPPGSLLTLADRARAAVVAVSPEVRYLASGEVWFGGGTVDEQTGLARHLSDTEIAHRFAPGDPRSVDTLAGCCVTASATTWNLVGGFDDRYFLLFEDADWSLRARSLGVDLIVDPMVRVDHAVSASFTGTAARLGLYYYARNGLLFGSTWSSTRQGRFLRPYRFLRRHVAPAIVGSWRRGERRDAARGVLLVLIAVSHHLRGRYGRVPRRLEQRLVHAVAPTVGEG